MKNNLYKFSAVILVIVCGLMIYAQVSGETDNFAQAKDFPGDACLYIQFADLPEVFRLWENSKLKENYLGSVNYEEFKNRHLALKIAERWNEFNAAFAIPFEAEAFGGLSEQKAALAVYDIGRLEFVFIAPMTNEKILASYFFRQRTGFEENALDGGEVVYSKEIEVDRGRQRQKLLFMNFRGRLVLATDEALFFRTLATLRGEKKSLADESGFKVLAEQTERHLAAVWVDQTKLNNDWYFKHYWLMDNPEELEKISAGMFGLELRENGLIEHRRFLKSAETGTNGRNLSAAGIVSLRKSIPADMPFYRIAAYVGTDSKDLIRKVLLENPPIPEPTRNRRGNHYFDDYEADEDYFYLDGDFETRIDDAEDAGVETESEENAFRTALETQFLDEFQNALERTNPSASVFLVDPQGLPKPLFLETRKALIFSVENPAGLNTNALEKAIAGLLQNRLTVAGSSDAFVWTTKESDGNSRREISTPFLDWRFFYAARNNLIVFANDEDLLRRILTGRKAETYQSGGESFYRLTAINFSEREKAFDDVIRALSEKNYAEAPESDFFMDNVSGLLDVLSDVETIEIRRSDAGIFIEETVEYHLYERVSQ